MTAQGVAAIDRTLQKTNQWLGDVANCLGGVDRQHAYSVLRAVLHTLRDRLGVDAAAHLGAQLPLLVRGIYYEGWHPSGKPLRIRSSDDLLAHVEAELGNDGVDPEDALRAVFRTLLVHVDPGEIDKIVRALPKPTRELWDSEPEERGF